MKPIPNYGDHMTIDDYAKACKHRWFIDYDGYGYWATETEMSNEVIIPSRVNEGIVDAAKVFGFTHVVWMNR